MTVRCRTMSDRESGDDQPQSQSEFVDLNASRKHRDGARDKTAA